MLQLFFAKAWMHGQGKDALAEALRNWEVIFLVTKTGSRFLQVQGHRIVQSGFNSRRIQLLTEPFAIVGLDDVQMINVFAISHFSRESQARVRKQFVIASRCCPAALIPRIKAGQLNSEKASLQSFK